MLVQIFKVPSGKYKLGEPVLNEYDWACGFVYAQWPNQGFDCVMLFGQEDIELGFFNGEFVAEEFAGDPCKKLEDLKMTHSEIADMWPEEEPLPVLRQNARVKLRKEWEDEYSGFYADDELPLTYLGEIPNMRGHGIFLAMTGKIYNGMHIYSFEEIGDD